MGDADFKIWFDSLTGAQRSEIIIDFVESRYELYWDVFEDKFEELQDGENDN